MRYVLLLIPILCAIESILLTYVSQTVTPPNHLLDFIPPLYLLHLSITNMLGKKVLFEPYDDFWMDDIKVRTGAFQWYAGLYGVHVLYSIGVGCYLAWSGYPWALLFPILTAILAGWAGSVLGDTGHSL